MILSWAIKYFIISFNKGAGSNAENYFNNDFLQLLSSAFEINAIIWPILLEIAILWIVNWFICYKGVNGGIEKLNKVLLPLEGATIGLNKLFTDWFCKLWI